MRWFVDITSWEPIAMDLRQLVRAFDAGRIDADTLVWRKGMPDWRRLRDVSELAERLIGGADASGKNDATAKAGNEPSSPDLGVSGSEPPPRQSERSRTPPASYTVGARSGSEPAAAGMPSQSSAPPPPEGVSVSTSAERHGAAPAADGATGAPQSRRSPSSAPRPQARRGRSKTPSRPNAAPLMAPSRTVTQTGLETPAEVAARNSIVPPAVADGAAARTRESRVSTAPAGARRPTSSDETPAQKPSSLSVPPGAIAGAPARPRSRRFLAIAAVVLGGAFVVKQIATSGDGASATAQRPLDAVTDPKQIEKALAPSAASSHPAPAASAPPSGVSASVAMASASSAVVASEQREPAPPSAGAEVRPVPESPAITPAPAANVPSVASAAPRPASPPPAAAVPSAALNVEASAKERVGSVGEAPPDRSPAVKVPPAAPVTAKAPVPSPAAAPTPRSVPVPTPHAPAAPAASEAPAAPRPPRPFDDALATRQFADAASKAAACSQAGVTRGTGRVKVAIEPWGRVGRVAHLNQDFVGTPVGVCVMEAFQQIQVPPFDGNSRSIIGDFVVE